MFPIDIYTGLAVLAFVIVICAVVVVMCLYLRRKREEEARRAYAREVDLVCNSIWLLICDN